MRTLVPGRLVVGFLAGFVTACTPSVGSRIVTPTTDSIILRVAGGMPPYVPGFDCHDHTALYTLKLRTHELAWDFCFTQKRGKRALASDEAATLDGMLAQLQVVDSQHTCPPDAPEMVLTTTGGVTREYRNDVCGAKPPLVDTDSVGKVLKVLMNLADK